MRRTGILLLVVVGLMALCGPLLTPHTPAQRFPDAQYAPPMPMHVLDDVGRWRAPFVYPVSLVNRLERRFAEDRARPVTLAWFSDGALARMPDESTGPWLPLGGDDMGRDVWARLVFGARLSLLVALVATIGALLIGALVGGVAGMAPPWADLWLMRFADMLIALPAMYVVLTLRASLPLVLSTGAVFGLVATILAVVGWPIVARGVRATVATERDRDYVLAARALGASPARVLIRHLLPAARGVLATQAALLLPSFVLAEATLSFVGLGFPEPSVSWGVMLQDAANVAALADAPWTLSPAVAIFVVSLAVNLVVHGQRTHPAVGRDSMRRLSSS